MLDGSRKLPYVNTNVTPFPAAGVQSELQPIPPSVSPGSPDELPSIHNAIVVSGDTLCHRVYRARKQRQQHYDTLFDIPATAS